MKVGVNKSLREGTVTFSVLLMHHSGFSAEYFNNVFLDECFVIQKEANSFTRNLEQILSLKRVVISRIFTFYGNLKVRYMEVIIFIFKGDYILRFYFEQKPTALK